MNEYTIDLSYVHTLYELHQYLKEVFSFPEYYGMNMDALWDCLYCAFSEQTLIHVKNESSVPKSLAESVKTFHKLLLTLAAEDPYVAVYFS